MKKLFRSTLFAGVLAFGVVACGDDVSVTDPGETPHPPLTVQLSDVSLNVGESANLAAQVSGGNPQASTSWTCESSSTDIVTVSESSTGCLVTAEGMGNTTVTVTVTRGSMTGSASAQVSVAELTQAQVSIHDIRQGGTTADIDNIAGQLDVVINVEPGDETPVQLDLLVDEDVVASQQFSQAQIAELQAAVEAAEASEVPVQITLSFNTGYYEIVDGAAWIRSYNGPREISANLHVAQLEAAPRASNTVTVIFNNEDGYHVEASLPTNSAMDVDGRRWYGGWGEDEVADLTVYPVFYSGQDAQLVTVGLCGDVQSESDAPFAFDFDCENFESLRVLGEAPPGEVPTVIAQYAVSGDDAPADNILNADHPFPARIDNWAPVVDDPADPVFSIVRQTGLDNVGNWLNDEYAFSNGYYYGNVLDAGVGKVAKADAGYQIRSGSDELIAPTPGLTGAGLAAELGVDAESVTNTEYNARVNSCDLLGNCRFFGQESDVDHPLLSFGYDETAPGLQFITDDMGVLEDARVIVDEFTTDDDISLVGTDIAAGFAPIVSGLSFQRALTQVGSTFDMPESPTVTVFGAGDDPVDMPFTTLDANDIVSTLESLAETPALGDEGFALAAQTTIEYMWSIGDYIEANAAADPNYYIYQVRLRDQAGNTTLGDRAAYHNNLARPEIEALTRSSGFPADPAFRVTFTHDDLELFEGSLALEYPNTGGVVVWERPGAEISSVLRLDAGIEDGVTFNDYIQRPHRDLMLDLQFASLGLPFLKNIQATDGTGTPVVTGVDNSKPVAAEAQVYNGLPLVETGTVHGTTENGQSDIVGVGIPPEEVPDFSVDYFDDTDIQSWGVVDTSAPNCEANYCARLIGPSGTFELPFAAVVIVWADAAAPTVWRVAEVATPNFSGSFPTRDDGAERLFEWHFDGSIEGSAGGDILFRAVGINGSGDGLLSAELTEVAPIPVQTRIDPATTPDSAVTVGITEGATETFTVTLQTSDDGGLTWDPVEGEDVTFSASGLFGDFNEDPPVVTSDVAGDATIQFLANTASTGTITATWGSHSVTWTVEITP
ncbi:MAG: hypothetical protein WD960_13240 [Gemmatimonadota bacterium]